MENKGLESKMETIEANMLTYEKRQRELLQRILDISGNLLKVKYMVDAIYSLLDEDDRDKVRKIHFKFCSELHKEEEKILKEYYALKEKQ